MNLFNKKVSRYCKNPTFRSILFSVSSSPKILNPFSVSSLYTTFNSNQLHTIPRFCNFSSGSPSDCSVSHPVYGFATNYHFQFLKFALIRHCCWVRWFSMSPSDVNCPSKLVKDVDNDKITESEEMGNDLLGDIETRKNRVEGFNSRVNYKHVSEIIEVARSGGSYSGFMSGSTDINLRLVTEIFRVLNCDRIHALHFFRFLQVSYPKLGYKSHVCSLMISNCGWLDDYETMIVMLKEFRLKRVCLDEKAFDFLPVLTSGEVFIMESIRRVIDTLNGVGGSCRGSGICSLIKMLCSLNSFEMAKFAIKITGKNVSHYNIIIREKCKKRLVGEVHGLLDEMRELGCDPNINTYNYLLSNLCVTGRMSEACTMVKSMEERGPTPNALTFDILIQHSCKIGNWDIAHQSYDQIVHGDIEPRIQTHVAFVKSYFNARNYEKALEYVRNLDNQHRQSINVLYSLVAYLYLKKGDVIIAQRILIEMMGKGLRPNFLPFIKIVKRLQISGKGSLARDLRNGFSRFTV